MKNHENHVEKNVVEVSSWLMNELEFQHMKARWIANFASMLWWGSLVLVGGWHTLWETLVGAYLWLLGGCPSLGPGLLATLTMLLSCCVGGITEVRVQFPPTPWERLHLSCQMTIATSIWKFQTTIKAWILLSVGAHPKDSLGSLVHFS